MASLAWAHRVGSQGGLGHSHQLGGLGYRQSPPPKGPPADLAEKTGKFSSQCVWPSHLLPLNLPLSGRTLARLPSLGIFASCQGRAVPGTSPGLAGTLFFPHGNPLRSCCLTQHDPDTQLQTPGTGGDSKASHFLSFSSVLTKSSRRAPGDNIPGAQFSLGPQGTSLQRSRQGGLVALAQN